MQKSIISWTQQTWNPCSGCSKVSDGCKHCYAAALSERYGWTTKPWTLQNEDENVVMKPHKLKEPYLLKEPTRVFVNSMSDQFHRAIPDWYRAAIFCVMLDLPQHTFQILTKRADATIDWHERFLVAVKSPEFVKFAIEVKDKRVMHAMMRANEGQFKSPWADHIWMGTSVEDARVIGRIADLQKCKAHVRFISAEPLIGGWPEHVDLTGIHWIIVGGESGNHMVADNPRWMKQEWARHIRDLCVAQKVAYFYKQDSGIRTEMRPYLVEADGSQWKWAQYPGNLEPSINIETGEVRDMGEPTQEPPKKTTLVNIRNEDVQREVQTHNPAYVYIGRRHIDMHLAPSDWANPFTINKDTVDDRAAAVANYRLYIKQRIAKGELNIEELRGKTLVCWCSPKLCHGNVLLELLGEAEPTQTQQQEVPQQPSLFDLDPVTVKHRYD